MPLEIDIISDVVCPWCIIGYKQLRKALDALPELFTPTLRWHPFELNPDMPPEGQDLREHIAMKYGATAAGTSGARQRLIALGESLGFHFDYFEGMRMVNTFKAHQLLFWAYESGRQTELEEVLFEGFFSRRLDVSDPRVLVSLAQEVGLDAVVAGDVLADGRYGEAVRAAQAHWLEQDVHAVPTFVFAQRYVVPGAQEAESFERVLRKMHSRLPGSGEAG